MASTQHFDVAPSSFAFHYTDNGQLKYKRPNKSHGISTDCQTILTKVTGSFCDWCLPKIAYDYWEISRNLRQTWDKYGGINCSWKTIIWQSAHIWQSPFPFHFCTLIDWRGVSLLSVTPLLSNILDLISWLTQPENTHNWVPWLVTSV